jgi:hypothetical protein
MEIRLTWRDGKSMVSWIVWSERLCTYSRRIIRKPGNACSGFIGNAGDGSACLIGRPYNTRGCVVDDASQTLRCRGNSRRRNTGSTEAC